MFKLAEEAFRAMKTNVINQEIIISGVSGSGKTEAAKLMLAYLANACNNFKYMDTGGHEGIFDQSMSSSSSSSSSDGEESDISESKRDPKVSRRIQNLMRAFHAYELSYYQGDDDDAANVEDSFKLPQLVHELVQDIY